MPRLPWFRLTLPYPHSWKVGECTCKALESGGWTWLTYLSRRFYEFIQSHFLSRQQCIASPVDLVVPWQQGRCDNKLDSFVRKCEAIRWQAGLPRGILYDFVGAGLGNYWSLIFTELKYENLNKFDTSVRHEIQFLSTSHISWNFQISIPSISEAWPPPVPNLRGYAPATPISKGLLTLRCQIHRKEVNLKPVCDSATSGHRKCTVACSPSKKVDLHFNPF